MSKVLTDGVDVIMGSAITSRLVGNTSYTKLKEIKILQAGTVTATFDMTGPIGAGTVYGKIYKNGVAYSSEQSVSHDATATKTITGIPVSVNDVIQVYCKYSTNIGTLQNFYIKCGGFMTDIILD
jgi:hypothetical protein